MTEMLVMMSERKMLLPAIPLIQTSNISKVNGDDAVENVYKGKV